jgi:hypothetical protein
LFCRYSRVLDEPRVFHAPKESLQSDVHLQPREWTAEANMNAAAPAEVLVVRPFGSVNLFGSRFAAPYMR